MGNLLREISCGKFVAGNSCRKILRKIRVGNLAGQGGEKANIRGSDWGKFTIWNRVIVSQLIRMQLRIILREKSCGKILREILVGISRRTFLWDKEEGEKAYLRKVVIGGNLAFGIG